MGSVMNVEEHAGKQENNGDSKEAKLSLQNSLTTVLMREGNVY